MDHHLRHLICDAIEKAAQTEAENLVLTPKTLEQYLVVVGKAQGLRLAIQILDETFSEYMNK